MNSSNLFIVVVCTLVGYWVVAAFLDNSKKDSLELTPTQPVVTPNCFVVLGVPATASAEEIHQAYERLMSQYHPDNAALLGPEIRDLAEKKTNEIRAAYEGALIAGGTKLKR